MSLDGLLVAGGLHRPAPDQLERFRLAIDNGRKALGFTRGIARAERAGLTATKPALKRAPRGYPMNHPRIDALRMRDLTVTCRHPLEPWLHQPACDERIRGQLLGARPLVKWLAETVGPSTPPRR